MDYKSQTKGLSSRKLASLIIGLPFLLGVVAFAKSDYDRVQKNILGDESAYIEESNPIYILSIEEYEYFVSLTANEKGNFLQNSKPNNNITGNLIDTIENDSFTIDVIDNEGTVYYSVQEK